MALAPLLLALIALAPVVGAHLRRQGRRWKLALAIGAALLLCEAGLGARHLEVRKLVGAALMPTGIAWLLLLMAIADRWLRRQRGGALILGVGWVILTLLGNTGVAGLLIRDLEASIPRDSGVGTFDAVFVLGGGTSVGPMGPELNASGDRVARAVELWRTGRTAYLVTSGSSLGSADENRSLAEQTARIWRSLGVPETAIVELKSSELVNTEAEIEAYQTEVAMRGWHRVGLVTSAWHLRRALRICHRLGFEVTPLAADWRSGPEGPTLWSVIPQAGALAEVEMVAKEYLGALKDG